MAAPPEDTSLLAALGVVGPMGLRSMTTAPGHRQQPVLSCLTRTAPEAHGGQPGGGRWSVRFLPLFSPTNFNVWWGFLPEALEKEMATHSSILAWRTPWTEEPGSVASPGLALPLCPLYSAS